MAGEQGFTHSTNTLHTRPRSESTVNECGKYMGPCLLQVAGYRCRPVMGGHWSLSTGQCVASVNHGSQHSAAEDDAGMLGRGESGVSQAGVE